MRITCAAFLLSCAASIHVAAASAADAPAKPPTTARATLVVTDAWIRVTPGVDMAAAYLTLRNVGSSPVTVIAVQTPLAGHAMIHETRIQSGQSQMRPHERVVVPAGQTVKFEPGGLHVMLHDLRQPLTVGQAVPLTLTLSGGGMLAVTATVRPLGAD